jgi:hypothetical protein
VPGGDGSTAVTTLADHLSSHALAHERIAMTLVSASAAIGVTATAIDPLVLLKET